MPAKPVVFMVSRLQNAVPVVQSTMCLYAPVEPLARTLEGQRRTVRTAITVGRFRATFEGGILNGKVGNHLNLCSP